jgi:hypothetical protein
MKTHQLLVSAVSISLAFAPALLAQTTTSNAVVRVAGTVAGLPESVDLTGTAKIRVMFATDAFPGSRPRLVVSINLDVSGRGLSSHALYSAKSEANLTRAFVATDVVEVTFPFFPPKSAATAAARTVAATFTLNYDPATGALTSASGSLAAPRG